MTERENHLQRWRRVIMDGAVEQAAWADSTEAHPPRVTTADYKKLYEDAIALSEIRERREERAKRLGTQAQADAWVVGASYFAKFESIPAALRAEAKPLVLALQAPRQAPLASEQIDRIWSAMGSFTANDHRVFARAIEAEHGILPAKP